MNSHYTRLETIASSVRTMIEKALKLSRKFRDKYSDEYTLMTSEKQMNNNVDTTLMVCPDGCHETLGGGMSGVPREFTWVTGEVGENKYCRECGSELVEANT